jgi:hypothetical protein
MEIFAKRFANLRTLPTRSFAKMAFDGSLRLKRGLHRRYLHNEKLKVHWNWQRMRIFPSGTLSHSVGFLA